ncbi:MAG: hypothetical protein JWO81_720 [Alphaproteobacteria bacterium]|nr:hypothetical protein [Alphaproteobacteria bacterium]
MTHSLALAERLSSPNLATFAHNLRKVEGDRLRVICDLIKSLDMADRTNWKLVILAAEEVGVSEDDLQRELGASQSTIYRWKNEDVAPREGTRRLMRGAVVGLVEQRTPRD